MLSGKNALALGVTVIMVLSLGIFLGAMLLTLVVNEKKKTVIFMVSGKNAPYIGTQWEEYLYIGDRWEQCFLLWWSVGKMPFT